jgi:hypothetical protein
MDAACYVVYNCVRKRQILYTYTWRTRGISSRRLYLFIYFWSNRQDFDSLLANFPSLFLLQSPKLPLTKRLDHGDALSQLSPNCHRVQSFYFNDTAGPATHCL